MKVLLKFSSLHRLLCRANGGKILVNKMIKLCNKEELPRFTIDGEINRQYTRFNAVRTQLTVRLLPPNERERI